MSKKPARDRGVRWGEGFIQERVNAAGTTVYQARWPEEGRAGRMVWRARTFADRDAAEDHLRTIGRQRRAGTYAPASMLTVGEIVTSYIERARSRLAERTILTYTQRAAHMIEPRIGGRRAVEVRTIDIQRWIDGLVRDGYRAATIHAAIAVLQGAFREATALGIVPANVTTGIRRPSIERRHAAIWTQEQARAVIRAVAGDPIYDALYRVALATGMRPGELRALRWHDVDLERRVLTVRTTITRGTDGAERFSTTTKTGADRAVAITAPIVDRLRWHRLRQHERRLAAAAWHELDLVFDRGDGRWLYQSQWLRFHVALCRRAGVPRITHHQLRHTSASLELEAGTHPRIVADRLGHSSVEITLDLYSHVSADLQRAAAESLSSRLFDDAEHDNIEAETR